MGVGQVRWVAATLPEQHPVLELNLLQTLFARIDKSFRIRLSAALQGEFFFSFFLLLFCLRPVCARLLGTWHP